MAVHESVEEDVMVGRTRDEFLREHTVALRKRALQALLSSGVVETERLVSEVVEEALGIAWFCEIASATGGRDRRQIGDGRQRQGSGVRDAATIDRRREGVFVDETGDDGRWWRRRPKAILLGERGDGSRPIVVAR